MPAPASAALRFDSFLLEPANARLTREGQPIELAPKAFDLLCHLAAHAGQLIRKDALLDAVWGHQHVSESVLKNAVNAIRGALGDDSQQPRFIETVPRRGYRFVARIDATPSPSSAARCPTDAAPPPPPHEPRTLVGRAQAWAVLATALSQALAGQPDVAWISGEAGIGKTSLLELLREAARAQGLSLALGHCTEQFGAAEPYQPLLEALAELCAASDSPWRAALREWAPTWLAQLPWLCSAEERAGLGRELAGAAQERMQREFATLLDRMTPRQPLLLVLEDLHWSDHATVSLLGLLARRPRQGRWLVAASYRPIDAAVAEHPLLALRHELRLHRRGVDLPLEAFSETDVDALLVQQLGGGDAAARRDVSRALQVLSEGLPLFVARVIEEWRDTGLCSADARPDWATLAASLPALRVPDGIAGLIERQLARLPGAWRQLLEAASVIGPEFSSRLLARLCDEDEASLRQRCDSLARRGEWLRVAGLDSGPDGALLVRYAFAHAWYQRVLLQRCAPSQALAWHLAAAQGLADEADTSRSHDAEIARHLELAHALAQGHGGRLDEIRRRAVRHRLRAAQACVALQAREDALNHFDRALAALHAEPDEAAAIEDGLALARALHQSAEVLQELGRGPQALERADQALAIARRLGDRATLAEALLTRAHLCRHGDLLDEAIACIDELLAGPVTPGQRHDALVIWSAAQREAGRLDLAEPALDQAEALADGQPWRLADILRSRIRIAYLRGDLADAQRLALRGQRLCESIGEYSWAAALQNQAGALAMQLGQPQEAEPLLQQARAGAAAVQNVEVQRAALLNLARLALQRGDGSAALGFLRDGQDLAEDFESPTTACAYAQALLDSHALLGELGTALHQAERLLELAQGLSSVHARVTAQLQVFDLLMQLGELATAESLLGQIRAAAGLQQLTPLWMRAECRTAWLALRRDPPEAVRRCLQALNAATAPADLAMLAWLRAEAAWLQDDAAAAWQVLDEAPPAAQAGLAARLLALRLRLCSRSEPERPPIEATLAQARAALAPGLPPLEALGLRGALLDGLRRLAEAGDLTARTEADRLHAIQRAELTRLADSLAGRAAVRDRLLAGDARA